MNKQKILGIVTFVMLVLGIIIFRGKKTLPGNPDERQTEILTRWHEAQVSAIGSKSFEEKFAELESRDCYFGPPTAISKKFADLPDSISSALRATVSELMQAYTKASPESLIKFAANREESLSKPAEEACRRVLIEGHGMTKDAVEKMSPLEAFTEWGQRAGFAPNWKAVVMEESCMSLWEFSGQKSKVEDFAEMSREQNELWRATMIPMKMFVPKKSDDLPDIISDTILFADFRIVVQHNEKYLYDRSPYVLRLRYDKRIKNWRAMFICHFPVPGSAIRKQGYLTLTL